MAGQLANSAAAAMNKGGAPAAGGPPPIPPSASWFVAVDGKPVGPMDLAAMRERHASKTLDAGTLVWSEGMAQWAPAGTVGGLSSLFS
jgi:hypothetical protein